MEPTQAGGMRVQFLPEIHGADFVQALLDRERKVAVIPQTENLEFTDHLGNTIYLTKTMAQKYLQTNQNEKASAQLGRLIRLSPTGPEVDKVKSVVEEKPPELLDEAARDVYEILQRPVRAVRETGTAVRDNRRALSLSFVRNNGLHLQYLPPEFQDDEEIVLTAVRQNKDAIQFASERMKQNSAIKEFMERQI